MAKQLGKLVLASLDDDPKHDGKPYVCASCLDFNGGLQVRGDEPGWTVLETESGVFTGMVWCPECAQQVLDDMKQ